MGKNKGMRAKVDEKTVSILVKDNLYMERAKKLAEKLHSAIIIGNNSASNLILQFDEDGLSLVSGNMKLHQDFTKIIRRIKQSNLEKELLIHAAKIKGKEQDLVAIDATAGIGEDSMLLAAYGFQVNLYENNPIIAESSNSFSFVQGGSI